MIGWTTLASRAEAETMGRDLAASGLVACSQVDGPITSIYRWNGSVETASEFRLTLKFLERHSDAVEAWIADHHPYETPQWLAIPAKIVGKNYLNWVKRNST